jgi:hypothetical protein
MPNESNLWQLLLRPLTKFGKILYQYVSFMNKIFRPAQILQLLNDDHSKNEDTHTPVACIIELLRS